MDAQQINKKLYGLGYQNYGYGAPAFIGEGYFYISPIGEGMPSKKGTKYTQSGKWIGAKVSKEVKDLVKQYAQLGKW